jgi:hypothetical protein
MELPFCRIDLLEADEGGSAYSLRSLMGMEAIMPLPHGPQQPFALAQCVLFTYFAVLPAPDAPR